MRVRLNPSFRTQTGYVNGKHFKNGEADISPAVAGRKAFRIAMAAYTGRVEIDGVWYDKKGNPETGAPKLPPNKLLVMPEEWRGLLSKKAEIGSDVLKLRQKSVMSMLKATKIQVQALYEHCDENPNARILPEE